MLPTLVSTNQFGEKSNNFIQGGSSQVNCNFIVDSTNGNGLGIRSLKGYGVSKVFMHTSATPAAGSPNPAAGYIYVQLSANYSAYLGGGQGFVSPTSGSNLAVNGTALTVGVMYVITSLGTSTGADWTALGVPAGVTPVVGLPFTALVVGSGSGSGQVQLSSNSGITNIEAIGDNNQALGATGGSIILMQCLKNDVLTAPANGTVVVLTFNMGQPASAPIL